VNGVKRLVAGLVLAMPVVFSASVGQAADVKVRVVDESVSMDWFESPFIKGKSRIVVAKEEIDAEWRAWLKAGKSADDFRVICFDDYVTDVTTREQLVAFRERRGGTQFTEAMERALRYAWNAAKSDPPRRTEIVFYSDDHFALADDILEQLAADTQLIGRPLGTEPFKARYHQLCANGLIRVYLKDLVNDRAWNKVRRNSVARVEGKAIHGPPDPVYALWDVESPVALEKVALERAEEAGIAKAVDRRDLLFRVLTMPGYRTERGSLVLTATLGGQAVEVRPSPIPCQEAENPLGLIFKSGTVFREGPVAVYLHAVPAGFTPKEEDGELKPAIRDVDSGTLFSVVFRMTREVPKIEVSQTATKVTVPAPGGVFRAFSLTANTEAAGKEIVCTAVKSVEGLEKISLVQFALDKETNLGDLSAPVSVRLPSGTGKVEYGVRLRVGDDGKKRAFPIQLALSPVQGEELEVRGKLDPYEVAVVPGGVVVTKTGNPQRTTPGGKTIFLALGVTAQDAVAAGRHLAVGPIKGGGDLEAATLTWGPQGSDLFKPDRPGSNLLGSDANNVPVPSTTQPLTLAIAITVAGTCTKESFTFSVPVGPEKESFSVNGGSVAIDVPFKVTVEIVPPEPEVQVKQLVPPKSVKFDEGAVFAAFSVTPVGNDACDGKRQLLIGPVAAPDLPDGFANIEALTLQVGAEAQSLPLGDVLHKVVPWRVSGKAGEPVSFSVSLKVPQVPRKPEVVSFRLPVSGERILVNGSKAEVSLLYDHIKIDIPEPSLRFEGTPGFARVALYECPMASGTLVRVRPARPQQPPTSAQVSVVKAESPKGGEPLPPGAKVLLMAGATTVPLTETPTEVRVDGEDVDWSLQVSIPRPAAPAAGQIKTYRFRLLVEKTPKSLPLAAGPGWESIRDAGVLSGPIEVRAVWPKIGRRDADNKACAGPIPVKVPSGTAIKSEPFAVSLEPGLEQLDSSAVERLSTRVSLAIKGEPMNPSNRCSIAAVDETGKAAGGPLADWVRSGRLLLLQATSSGSMKMANDVVFSTTIGADPAREVAAEEKVLTPVKIPGTPWWQLILGVTGIGLLVIVVIVVVARVIRLIFVAGATLKGAYVVVDGTEKTDLSGRKAGIGSSRWNAVVLRYPDVAARHARIVAEKDPETDWARARVEHLATGEHRTTVGAAEITAEGASLSDGAEIVVGGHKLRFYWPEDYRKPQPKENEPGEAPAALQDSDA